MGFKAEPKGVLERCGDPRAQARAKAPARVLRGMMADADGLPVTGTTGRYLGVRPGVDVPVDADGFVESETEGMGVVPPPVDNLQPHRRPPEFGGTGKDPVFEIETNELPEELRYRPDPADPEGHGFVEPARRMSFEEYQQLLHSTLDLWRAVRQWRALWKRGSLT